MNKQMKVGIAFALGASAVAPALCDTSANKLTGSASNWVSRPVWSSPANLHLHSVSVISSFVLNPVKMEPVMAVVDASLPLMNSPSLIVPSNKSFVGKSFEYYVVSFPLVINTTNKHKYIGLCGQIAIEDSLMSNFSIVSVYPAQAYLKVTTTNSEEGKGTVSGGMAPVASGSLEFDVTHTVAYDNMRPTITGAAFDSLHQVSWDFEKQKGQAIPPGVATCFAIVQCPKTWKGTMKVQPYIFYKKNETQNKAVKLPLFTLKQSNAVDVDTYRLGHIELPANTVAMLEDLSKNAAATTPKK